MEKDLCFEEVVQGLNNGDFSRLDPLFEGAEGSPIMRWFEEGRFTTELAEALSCACFNGRTEVAELLIDRGVDPAGGNGTGLNAFHWAANRGQLEAVKLLIRKGAPLESVNSYGGTVLNCAVWSAINEPKPDHVEIIRELIEAGADVSWVKSTVPTGNLEIDGLISR